MEPCSGRLLPKLGVEARYCTRDCQTCFPVYFEWERSLLSPAQLQAAASLGFGSDLITNLGVIERITECRPSV